MNTTKKINVNFSSLVGLKAELLRKQTEVKETKLKTESVNTLPQLSGKKRIKKTVAEDTKKITKDVKDVEDIASHKKSKLMLEAKARLYERLKRSKTDNNKFLVDFKNKDESDEESVDEEISKQYPIEPDENWVEYQDCFGRTRRCLREDLPHMQRKDDLIKHEIMKGNIDDGRVDNKEEYIVQEKEPEIEIMRRKWEEQTQKLADKTDIHYQDILFDEARTHGVGYYAFSQDEEERAKQQENLANLRKETEKKQRETKEIRELKERMEQNRLKAARIRQRIRAGLPAEPTEEELAQENNSINCTTDVNINAKTVNDESAEKIEEKSDINDKSTNKENNITDEKTVNEDKIRAFGELLGKKNHWHVMSQEEWVDKCRNQRINEFAPIYGNFVSAGYNSSLSIDKQSSPDDNEKSDVEADSSQKVTDNNDLKKYEILPDDDSTSNESFAKYMNNDSQNRKNSLDNSEDVLIRNSQSIRHEAYAPEQPKLPIDIPLPDENTTFTPVSDHTDKEALPQSINEDKIMAGLKYLRERFEESHSK